MMNKQRIYTTLGIALSFSIAVGGWTLTSMLIDRKSDALLSATGIIRIDTPSAKSPETANQGDSGTEEEYKLISNITNFTQILYNYMTFQC